MSLLRYVLWLPENTIRSVEKERSGIWAESKLFLKPFLLFRVERSLGGGVILFTGIYLNTAHFSDGNSELLPDAGIGAYCSYG